MTSDSEAVPLLVTLGHAGDNSFILRFPVEYSDEILALLDEHNVEHGTALELSADQPLWLEVVQFVVTPGAVVGGMAAIASVIRTVVTRHSGKKFVLKSGEFEVEASGYSEIAVERFLEKRAREQAELDARTRRVLGLDSNDESADD